jgi:hypothetical protein
MDLSSKNDTEISNWIKNHEAKPGATELPLYRQLLEERARRTQSKHHLNFEKSLAMLKEAAVKQVCVTYGDLAKASGVSWSQARYQMNGASGHLDRLLDLCHARDLPLLTAICVNQAGVHDGELSEAALNGFVAGARRLGIAVTDGLAFHRQCRDECWKWGREQPTANAL